MKIVEIDVDGVLLDVHSALEKHLHNIGYPNFFMENVRTYDFNYSFIQKLEYPSLTVTKDFALEQFKDLELFKSSEWDIAAISFIKKALSTGAYKIIINSEAFTDDIILWKLQCLKSMLGENNANLVLNITKNKPAFLEADALIEDNYLRFSDYKPTTQIYMLDKPYNKTTYNEQYLDLLNASNVHRCKDVMEALNKAFIGGEKNEYINFTLR